MTRPILLAASLMALCFLAPEGRAQGPAAPAPTQEDEIVVVGQRTEEAIRAFVGELSAANRSENQLARWDRRICPGVAGLRARYAQFVIDRMAQRALDVGLDVGEPGCRANILIVVSLDPDAVARELFENNRDAMGYFYQRGRRTMGRRALQAFVESDAPVRWWHVSRTVSRDGEAVGDTSSGGAPVQRLTGNASRLSRTTRQDFGSAFVVVDARRLKGVGFDALADYVAMISLAQVDPATDTSSFDTILNVFAARPEGAAAPTALTTWDIAYMRGLYAATRDAASASRQESEIARSMGRDLAPKP
jgi:hypothetical protein